MSNKVTTVVENVCFQYYVDFGMGGEREVEIDVDNLAVEIDLDEIDADELIASLVVDDIAIHVAENASIFMPLIIDNLDEADDEAKDEIECLLDYLNQHQKKVLIGFIAKHVDQGDLADAFLDDNSANNDDLDSVIDNLVDDCIANNSAPESDNESAAQSEDQRYESKLLINAIKK